MDNYKEWIIQYHGDLQKVLQKINIMVDVINEKYAIIRATEKEANDLSCAVQIEHIEESREIYQVYQALDSTQLISIEKEKHGLSGKGVTVGWIGHKPNINYNNYKKYGGETRILCMHDGIRQYNQEEIMYLGHKDQEHGKLHKHSSMEMCIGNEGIAPESEIILVDWQKEKFYTADVIRAVRFIIDKTNTRQKPLVIHLPFDISEEIPRDKNLVLEIISEMTLWGKIAIVGALEVHKRGLEVNLGLTIGPIFSTCAPLTVGALALLMEWGVARMNDPLLYGQKLRTYYIKNMVPLLKKRCLSHPFWDTQLWLRKPQKGCDRHDIVGKVRGLSSIDELVELLIPLPKEEAFRTLDLAYELAPADVEIDAFIVYNNLDKEPIKVNLTQANLYPLVFPYLGIRGTVAEIKKLLSGHLQTMITGSLAYILGSEPLDIKPAGFKTVSILSTTTKLKGTNTLIGIIDTGIDYTNPVFIDSEGKTRIMSIWDQTTGNQSPYGYGTIYNSNIINEALQSPSPFEIVPHKDEWGSGTILAGVAAGYCKDGEKSYKGVAPGASIVVVKLVSATPAMQEIYYGNYNPLGFSALDIARAFEYLATLANQYQKPISICLPMGTNSGPHDGTSILDTIIISYAGNPGVSVVLPASEEANKAHHASGNLKEEREQEIKLTIPQGQSGFIIEIWATFGDRIEVLLTSPKSQEEESTVILLNKGQTYKISNDSFVWSQGSKIDTDTGCQVIRFRLGNPLSGDWVIKVRGIVVIDGRYDIWIPKTGMILPKTVLSPADPFTTIYNTSAAAGLITVACYDKKSLSPTPSSGRGFARDNRVKPDFMVSGVDIPGPLPGQKWGLVTGTSVASAITVGVSSLIYEDQLIKGEQLANTLTMKAHLVNEVKREPTMTYPNPSRGYGLLDISTIVQS